MIGAYGQTFTEPMLLHKLFVYGIDRCGVLHTVKLQPDLIRDKEIFRIVYQKPVLYFCTVDHQITVQGSMIWVRLPLEGAIRVP